MSANSLPPLFMAMKNIVCIIPACNEGQTITNIVRQCRTHGDVIVVDDCCEDETARLAKAAGAVVLHLPYRMGAWNAAQAGIHFASRFPYEHFVTLDADAQHDPADIPALLDVAKRDLRSIVIGSCVSRGSRARKLAWAVFRRLTALPCADLTSGYRIYGRSAIPFILSRKATLCEYQDIGILMLLKRNGFSLREVEINMCPRQNGASRIFSNWGLVIIYLLKTIIISIVGHFDVPETETDDWRCYDQY